MNISDYIEIVSTTDQVMHFKLKGFWQDDLTEEMWDAFCKTFSGAVDKMGGNFVTITDTTELKPPGPKGKELMAENLKYAKENGLYRAVEIMPSALIKMTIKSAAESTGKDDFRVVVSSIEEAKEKVKEIKASW